MNFKIHGFYNFERGEEVRRNRRSLILLPSSIKEVNIGLGASGEDDDVDGHGDDGRQKEKRNIFYFPIFSLDMSPEMRIGDDERIGLEVVKKLEMWICTICGRIRKSPLFFFLFFSIYSFLHFSSFYYFLFIVGSSIMSGRGT